MSFYTYMMRTHLGKDTPAGDLAADIRLDREKFPRNGPHKFDGWHRLILAHLRRNHASDACLETFEECWKEYVACEKSKLKRR